MQTERTRNSKTGLGLRLMLRMIVLLMVCGIFQAGAATARAQGLLYVLRYVSASENQIHGFRVNETTGALSALAGFPLGTGGNAANILPSEQLTIDAANGRLYVINNSSNTISAYAINSTTGALTALPFSPINLGTGDWFTLAVHPSGSPLVVGDGGGRILSYRITATTATAAAGSPYTILAPNSTAFSRDGNFVYTGGNALTSFSGFRVNAATGVLTALAGTPFDSGANFPSAYATDSAGRLFLTNYNTGQVRAFSTAAGIPSAVSGNPFTSGLTQTVHGVVHPNGFYLVADRSGNRVGVYRISGSGAATTLAAVAGSPFASGGILTDVLALNQSGAFLFAANGNSRNLTTFGVNSTTGVLTTLDTQPADTLGTSGRLIGMGYFQDNSQAGCTTNPVVTTTADSGAGSLRQAIADACAGSTITFDLPANSTITLTSGQLVIDKGLSINGPGANLLTISGNQASRVFYINSGLGSSTVTLNGLTIANGKITDDQGGGLYINDSFVSMTNCTIHGNTSFETPRSGAVGSVKIGGAGIYNFGFLTLTNCTVSNNMIVAAVGLAGNYYGAGIRNDYGALTLTNSTVSGNQCDTPGGARGGGLYNGDSLVTVTNSTISGNQVATFDAKTILGAGIYNYRTDLNLTSSTISGNGNVNSLGSGIYKETGTVNVRNTIIAGNIGVERAVEPSGNCPDVSGGLTSQGHNLIGKGNCSGLTNGTGGNQVGTIAAPLDPKLGPLAANGGPTQTHTLLVDSPAINAGDGCVTQTPGCLSTPLTTDQRGAGFARQLGAAVDIGALEFNSSCRNDPIVTTNADSGAGSLRDAIANACPGSTITFNLPANSTITLTSGELVIDKNLMIQGPGAHLLTVSGNRQTRVFRIAEALVNATLSGLTIANGYHKTPDVVSSAQFVQAENAYGGGLYTQSSGTVNVTDCVLTGNRAQGGDATGMNSQSVVSGVGFGGAVAQRGSGTLNLNGCRFSNNQAFTGTASGAGNIFSSLAFPSEGGAVFSDATLDLNQCALSGNSAARGGAIANRGSMTLTAGTVSGNEALLDWGGGVYDSGAASTIINTTLSGNVAGGEGGGIWSRSISRVITNCTITGNQGGQFGFGGGGLFGNINPPLQLKNTIIAGNTAGQNPDLKDFVTSLGNNLIGDGTGANGLTNGVNGDQVGTTAAPLDAKLGPLADNGGPTLTHRLLPGSPAINAGTGNGAPAADQRGLTRDGNVDIGAVEARFTLTATGGTPQTTLVGTSFAAPLSATLTENGLPLANVPLTFSAPGSGASAAFPNGATATTNAQGQAGVNAAANLVQGSYAVLAATAGLPPVPFSLTNTCPTITLAPLPQATAGVLFNAALIAAPAGGNYQFSSANLPAWLTLTPGGSLSGTPPALGTFNFNISAGSFGGACTQKIAVTLTVVCPTITLTPASLPNAAINTTYPTVLSAVPSGAYGFALTGGSLPAGLTLNSNGSFSGAPTQSGVFSFRITATGFSGGCGSFRDYVLTVQCPSLTLAPTTLPGGTVGTAYNQSVTASPAGSYDYSVTSGALPTGLMLNAATGAITGAPASSGTFNFTITASAGACAASRTYSVTIACAGVTLASLSNGTAGVSYAGSVAASPSGSYNYSLIAGNLPTGLTLNTTTGAINGLPTVTGAYNFTVKAQITNGCSGQQSYTLTITCPTVALSGLPTPTLNSPYNQTVTASPSGGNYGFAVSAGALPAGLSLNSATGAITGTPTAGGAHNFTILATGFGGCAGSQAYNFVIGGGGCATISLPGSLPNGTVGGLYSNSAAASPAGSYSYAVSSGTLPPGTTLYTSFGLIFGHPTAAGGYTFTVTATLGACTASQTYTVMISAGFASALSVGSDFDGDLKSDLSIFRADGNWEVSASSDGKTQTTTWGAPYAPYNDLVVSGDYDGDGKTDQAVFRRGTEHAGYWFIKRSSDHQTQYHFWGLPTDVPTPGDYDGDRKTDVAVWRASEGIWYVIRSSDGTVTATHWGAGRLGDVPVPGDYDGDGKTDAAVFRKSNGHWYVKRSSDGKTLDVHWGLGTDVPVPGDYDGDAKTDYAVWRASEGTWYWVESNSAAVKTVTLGAAGDVPVPTDYDGDGKADAAIWQAATGNWQIVRSSDGKVLTRTYGRKGDTPVPARGN